MNNRIKRVLSKDTLLKRTILQSMTGLFVYLLTLAPMANAQGYRAVYEGEEINLIDGEVTRDLFFLDINGSKSLFRSYYRMQRDSIRKAELAKGVDVYEAVRKARRVPPGTRNRVYYDGERDLFTEVDYGDCYFMAEEKLAPIQYHFSDSTKVVAGYTSHMASAHILGREWVVYYTNEIPLPYGPWKIHQLPGLVTEAYTRDGAYRFTLTGFKPHTGEQDFEIPKKLLGLDVKKISKEELMWIRKLSACGDTRPITKKYFPKTDMSRLYHDKIDQRYRELSKRYQYIEK